MLTPLRAVACLLVPVAFFGGPLQAQTPPVLVRHAPTLNGTVEGSLQQMTAESVTLNGGGAVTAELLVPGSPKVRINGSPTYGGSLAGGGAISPKNHQVTLNSGARLGKLRTRTDPVSLPMVEAPPPPAGTRSVSINSSGQSPGDFATLRNLTLNGNVGPVSVPPGNYGNFTANSGSVFTLGAAGATTPSIYAFQHLTLNGNSRLDVAGPVIITLASGASFNSSAGNPTHSEWLTLQIHSGGLTLNGAVRFSGSVIAPNGPVTINGNSLLTGNVACDRLTINSGGILRVPAATTNVSPTVSLVSPASDTVFPAPASFILRANASDSDGTIASVAFYQGTLLLGQTTDVPYVFDVSGLAAGSYSFNAKAADNSGAVTTSASVTLLVNAPPAIALSGPPADMPLAAPASVTITAAATDTDGSIARVEFYRGGLLIGISTVPEEGTSNYAFTDSLPLPPGNYVYQARAYDNFGGYADSAPLAVTVFPALPYQTDFETAEGYSPGALDAQLGWKTLRGSASIITTEAFSGSQSVVVSAGSPGGLLAQTFAPLVDEDIFFVDFFAKPVAGTDINGASLFKVESSHFAFLQNGTQGLLEAFSGNGAGGGRWLPTNFTATLNTQQQTSEWIRLTARLDFSRKSWDLYAAGNMVAADLGFSDDTRSTLSTFSLQGHAEKDTLLDYFMAGPDNPLFEDINKNGIDDAWETVHGLSLAKNNRGSSPSGSGLTVLQAYLQGTDPNDFFNGQIPLLTIAGGDNQIAETGSFNALPLSVLVRNATGSGILSNAPVTFAVTQGGGGLALDRTGTISPAAALTLRTDPAGFARIYFKQPALIGIASAIQATASSARVSFHSTSADPDYYHGVAPEIISLQDESGQLSSDGALSVLVLGEDGSPMNGAPVTFTADGSGHLLAMTAGGTGHPSVEVRSNSQGVARAYVVPQP